MKKLNIEILKQNPKTKLIIEHYQKETPILWLVPKWEIALGCRVSIKMPTTGYETGVIILVDSSGEIKDVDGNLVGTLCIADEDDLVRITIDELVRMTCNLKIGQSINFECDIEAGNSWGIQKVDAFDAPLILIGSYGGGRTCCFDAEFSSKEEIAEFVRKTLEDFSSDLVYINPLRE